MPSWPNAERGGLSFGRALLLATVAMIAAALLLHRQLASALVTRGDDLLYQGNGFRALGFYARALFFDRDDATAADRYVFVSLMLGKERFRKAGLEMATEYLARHDNPNVRLDRALCERALHLDVAAERDFVAVARLEGDARSYVFAGYSALRQNQRARARGWWRSALALHPGYVPALRALSSR